MDIKLAARGTSIVFSLTFIGLGLNYIYGIFLARWFGVEEYGLFSIGLSIFNVVSVLSTMGLESAVIRFVPRVESKGYSNLYKNIYSLGFVFSTFVGISLYLLSSKIAIELYNNNDLTVFIKLFALSVPAYACTSIGIAFLQASHNVLYRMLVKYISEPIIKLLLTLLFVSLGYHIIGAVIAICISIWISFILVTLPKLIESRKKAKKSIKQPAILKSVFNYSFPLFIGTSFSICAAKSDIILLGYLSSIDQVGLYAAAFQTAAILTIALQSIESVLAPYISEAINSNNRNKIQEVYRLSLRWVFISGLPVFIIFISFSTEILNLYGKQFIDASLCFIILSFGQFINLATGSAGYMLLMLGKSKFVMINAFIYGCLQIGLNIYLIPDYGLLGAAISMVISQSVINIIRLIEVYFFIYVQPYSIDIIKPTIIGLIIYHGILYSKNFINIGFYYIPLVIILYFILLLLFGLSKDDKHLLGAIITKVRSL